MTQTADDRHLLVTGATGRIGSVLVPRLLQDWPRLTILGRGLSRAGVIGDLAAQGRVQILPWDLRHPEPPTEVVEQLRDVTDLIHGAALADDRGPIGPEAVDMVRTNINGAIHLLRRLPALRHVSYLSTVAVYGPPQTLPCPEAHPTEPTRLYGMTKLALEHFLRIHADRNDQSLSVLRISSVYGFPDEGVESSGAVATFLRLSAEGKPIRLVRTAELLRDYVHVTDVAEAVAASATGRCPGIFNIASGQGHSLIEIAQQAGRIAGTAPAILVDQEREPDSDFTKDCVYDITRAQASLEWCARTPLFGAMRILYDRHQAQTTVGPAGVTSVAGGVQEEVRQHRFEKCV